MPSRRPGKARYSMPYRGKRRRYGRISGRFLEAAASLAGPSGEVSHVALARELGCPVATVHHYAWEFRKEGRWPYRSRFDPTKFRGMEDRRRGLDEKDDEEVQRRIREAKIERETPRSKPSNGRSRKAAPPGSTATISASAGTPGRSRSSSCRPR